MAKKKNRKKYSIERGIMCVICSKNLHHLNEMWLYMHVKNTMINNAKFENLRLLEGIKISKLKTQTNISKTQTI
jgi:hypothetical protein